MVPEQIEREIVIAAPVDRVWAVLTEPEHVAGWFGDRAVIDLRPGGAVAFHWAEDGTFLGTVERVEPQGRFSYRWVHKAGDEPRQDNTTLVEFTLSPDGAGTRLRVVESGFHTLALPVEEQARNAAMNTEGWRDELDDLRDYVAGIAA